MDKALRELIKISVCAGKDKSLVQGGGGNTSVKTGDGRYMYIKASGAALKEMSIMEGWRKLRLAPVLEALADKAFAHKSLCDLFPDEREERIKAVLNLSCEDNIKTGSRPSVESPLHAILGRCVVHLHPVAAGAYVCSRDGKAVLERLFKKEKFPALWVPYADPGYTLAVKVAGLVEGYRQRYNRLPSIIFLQNHGVFISADSAEGALKILRRVISICGSHLNMGRPVSSSRSRRAPLRRRADKLAGACVFALERLAIRKAYFEVTGRYAAVRHFSGDIVRSFLKRRDAKKLLSFPALTPDELVYANGPALWIDRCDCESITRKLRRQIAAGLRPYAAFLVKGAGLFIAGRDKAISAIRDITESSLAVRCYASTFGGVKSLNRRQQDFIIRWEAESFRQEISSGSAKGELAGRIAVVTGAGSGLGRSIAIGLARAGAMVGLLDVDKKSAGETSRIIQSESPEAATLVLKCDVTRERDEDEALGLLVGEWGGMDILVNAAGIAPAYPLTELPLKKWRQTLEINLTGYFLMARAAARLMIVQGMEGSIINISSKSGLEASRDNTPYNATKAGEIHMARGWALELGRYGIRVNSVAPGNVFEGSKIWNPKYIKACAKKYGIRPEEVIPYYTGKTALNIEIKGQDVADCVCFLCSDRARTITGQTIVADAGQVMVR